MFIQMISAVILSFLLSFFAIPALIKIAHEKGVFDIPAKRKLHFAPIPSFGGIVFFASVILSICMFVPFGSDQEMQYYVAAAVLIFFIGLKDDIIAISAWKKLVGQLFAAFILVYMGGFQINSLYGFLGIQQLDPIMTTLFSFLTILVIINAFNLIDGVNGLAGGLSIIALLFFGTLFYKNGNYGYSILAFSTAASVIAFLFYNVTPAKIFMGDTGSLFIGLTNSVLIIKFINTDFSSVSHLRISENAALGFAAIFVPLVDTLRVFAIRLTNGKSPFDPDTNHIHHLLLSKGLTHNKVTLLLTSKAVISLLIAYFLQPFGINVILLSLVSFAGLFLIYARAIHVPLIIDSISKKDKAGSVKTSQQANKEEPSLGGTVIFKN